MIAQAHPLSPLVERLVARAAEVEQLRRLAGRDELTGLANRRTFNDVLERELARAARSHEPVSLLLLDLDRLKAINDHFGHAAGDRALRQLAQSAEASVRNGDVVARVGGDEFAVVLPSTSLCEALSIGERIRDHLADAGTRDQPLGLSFGAAVAHSAVDPSEDLLREADRALYRDKLARRSLRPPA
jgi:diguanylate cyclase (GGDEF)-like protein